MADVTIVRQFPLLVRRQCSVAGTLGKNLHPLPVGFRKTKGEQHLSGCRRKRRRRGVDHSREDRRLGDRGAGDVVQWAHDGHATTLADRDPGATATSPEGRGSRRAPIPSAGDGYSGETG